MPSNIALDRLAMRSRPAGSPIMAQRWEQILFLHWPVPIASIRPLVPSSLEIDSFDGSAWVSITPFRLSGLRLPPLPSVPGLDTFDELNVRTYTHFEGKPGIFFLSLDASKLLPAVAARLFYQLPYYSANITFSQSEGEYRYELKRGSNPEARFCAKWRRGIRLRDPDVKSLAFFLLERYAFLTDSAGRVSLTRAYHAPWIVDEAVLESLDSTMLQALGLPESTSAPLAHFSDGVDVQIWPPVVA